MSLVKMYRQIMTESMQKLHTTFAAVKGVFTWRWQYCTSLWNARAKREGCQFQRLQTAHKINWLS